MELKRSRWTVVASLELPSLRTYIGHYTSPTWLKNNWFLRLAIFSWPIRFILWPAGVARSVIWEQLTYLANFFFFFFFFFNKIFLLTSPWGIKQKRQLLMHSRGSPASCTANWANKLTVATVTNTNNVLRSCWPFLWFCAALLFAGMNSSWPFLTYCTFNSL